MYCTFGGTSIAVILTSNFVAYQSPIGVQKLSNAQYLIRPVVQQRVQQQPIQQQVQQHVVHRQPVQQRLQPTLPREWVRKPVQQQTVQTQLGGGVKGIKNYQYFIQGGVDYFN